MVVDRIVRSDGMLRTMNRRKQLFLGELVRSPPVFRFGRFLQKARRSVLLTTDLLLGRNSASVQTTNSYSLLQLVIQTRSRLSDNGHPSRLTC
jgi:hypothetical protein